MANPIQALVFDAYGTLFDVHSVITACESRFPGRGTELSRLWRSKQLEYTWLRSLMGRHADFAQVTAEGLRFACRTLGLSCPPETEAVLLAAYQALDCFPEVKDALEALAPRPLVILSNGSPAMLAAVVRHQGLEPRFAAVLSVEAAGIFKPHPSVYALAPQRLGLPPEAIGFVSANGWDVAGAAAFGFTTFWVNRADAPEEVLPACPRHAIRSLAEIPGLLG
ncbi:MAG: haloacid dehalogenase type II [Acidobacteria bacterium]|nr:haloacid dehalogenase type II [Acidobacteriota bacterium]